MIILMRQHWLAERSLLTMNDGISFIEGWGGVDIRREADSGLNVRGAGGKGSLDSGTRV
jgi:hypothetical protein